MALYLQAWSPYDLYFCLLIVLFARALGVANDALWVFGSVVAVAFQIIFRAEKHANNVFSFFKNHF